MLLDLKLLKNNYNMDIKGVIHIGAHKGQENKVYNELAIANRMFFEPLSTAYAKLLCNVDSRIYPCYNVALGNMKGSVSMYVDVGNEEQSSSILEPDYHLKQYPLIQFPKREVVTITTLDSIDFDRSKFNFINIDVQGYELEVFKGAERTLSSIDYIMTEVNVYQLYQNCVLLHELDTFLKTYGFVRTDTDLAGGTWGDALYVKTSI